MTIVYEGVGDIFSCDAQTLVCTVNCKGAMGAGIAREFRDRCYGLYDAYRRECYSKRLTTNTLFLYKPRSGPCVLCFPTKDDWKDPSKLEYVENGLRNLSEQYESLGITSIAIPPLGCGLGRLDYHYQIRPLMYRYLDPIDLDVSILFAKNLQLARMQY